MIKRPPLARRGLENPANIQTGNPDILPKNRCFEAHCLPTSPRQELNLKCSLKPLTMSSTAASVGRIPHRTVSRQHLRCNSTDKSLKPCSVNRRQIFDARQIGLKATNRIRILQVSCFTYFHWSVFLTGVCRSSLLPAFRGELFLRPMKLSSF